MARLPWARWGRAASSPEPDLDLLVESTLFDESWIQEQTGRRFTRQSAARFYLAHWRDGLQPHPLVDPLSIWGSWTEPRRRRLADAEPLTALLRGHLWGTATHPLFDARGYLDAVPDARSHPDGPSGHYLATGAASGLGTPHWVPAGTRLDHWLIQQWRTPPLLSAPIGHGSPMVVWLERYADLGAAVRVATESAQAGLNVVVATENATPQTRAGLAALPLISDQIGLGGAETIAAPFTVRLRDVRALARGSAWAEALLDAAQRGADLVAPVLLTETGAIVTAGRASATEGSVPMLAGFAGDEAEALDGVDFTALDERAVLMATDRLTDSTSGALTRRLVPAARLVVEPDPPVVAEREVSADERRLWAQCGFDVDDVTRAGQPAVTWRGAALAQPRPLRWAIKNPAVSGVDGDVWGDTHFAASLAAALRAQGHHVVVDRRGEFDRETGSHDDVALLLRGRKEWPTPSPGQPRAAVNLAWIISHPDQVTAHEMAAFDRVFAASVPWADQHSVAWQRPVTALLQATDPARFARAPRADGGSDVVFVGSTRGEFRQVVRDARQAGVPLTIYGGGWQRFLHADQIAGDFVANERLADVYNQARIVLNDHWEDMRTEGFISNRIFDAVAAGARVISDPVPGLKDLFGSAVQTYTTVEELEALATAADLDAVFGSAPDRAEISRRICAEHSFAARAATLAAAAYEAIAERRLRP